MVIEEIAKDDLSKIGSRVNKFSRKEIEDEPFNDVFDNKYRIVVPILDNKQQQFQNFLLNNGMKNINYEKGTGVLDIKTERGISKREIRIGKFLQQLNDKVWLDFWQKNKGNLVNKDGVSVIVSRHPIDIVRMSDHDEWKSCHSPGGSFWRCAIQEAKTGGAIAYVVRNRDLNKIKDLQAKDIFKDKDRGINGIEPLERVRLRRFSDDKHNYLVPDLRTYGIKNVGFYNTVKQWALSVQKDKLTDVDYSKLKRHGGSYQDSGSKSDQIWTAFLDKYFSGNKESVDQDDEEDKEPDLENLVRQALAGHTYEHFSASYYVHDNDDVSGEASVSFEFPKDEFSDEIPNNTWELEKEIKNIELYIIDNVEIEDSNQSNNIVVKITVHSEGSTIEDFENFLDDLDGYDKKYDEYYKQIQYVLWNNHHLYIPALDDKYKNFRLEIDDTRRRGISYNYETYPKVIGNLQDIPQELYAVQNRYIQSTKTMVQPKKELDEVLLGIINKYDPKGLDLFSSRLFTSKSVKDDYIGSREEFHSGTPLRKHGNVPVYFSFSFEAENLQEASTSLKQLDNIFPQIIEEIKKWWEEKRKEATEENDGQHPATSLSIKWLKDYFTRNYLFGDVSIKNNQYWYQDENFNAPARDVVNVIKESEKISRSYWEKIRIFLLRGGQVITKYKGNKPEFFWLDEEDGTELPIEQAITKYKQEYIKKYGRQPREY